MTYHDFFPERPVGFSAHFLLQLLFNMHPDTPVKLLEYSKANIKIARKMILKPKDETHSWNTSYNHCTYLNSDYFFGRSLLSLALFYDLQIFGGSMSKW